MKHGVGDSRRNAHHADLSQALGAEWVHHIVVLLDENHFDVVNVGIDGNVVLADGLQRIVERDLAAVDRVALRLKRMRDVA